MKIEPLTRRHYIDFNGESPQVSTKGLALVDDGNVYGMVGKVLIGGQNFIIFGVKPGFSKRDIIKGWREFEPMLDDSKHYYAIIDRELETAHGLLTHFGFMHLFDDVYIYGGAQWQA
jgi:hypothetical protein